jgi:hypothetical protein
MAVAQDLLQLLAAAIGPNRQFAATQDNAGNGVLSGRSAGHGRHRRTDPFQEACLSGYDALF